MRSFPETDIDPTKLGNKFQVDVRNLERYVKRASLQTQQLL